MGDSAETTFGSFQMDERFKKLQRSLKLALLRREHMKNVHNDVPSSLPTWPSISSINADTLDLSCTALSQAASRIGSEVLASSNNLRNTLLKKRNNAPNREAMVTSSVRRYNVKQDNHVDRCIMPPPTLDKVYRTCKKPQNRIATSSDCGRLESTPLNSSVQSFALNNFPSENASSCVTVNTNNNQEYLHSYMAPVTSANDSQNVNRVFMRWRVMLNDQHQLLIKGTLKCGKVVRSKPVIRRYTATCVESIYKHKYNLQGNIVDEKNELPDYIRGKFYNGFPDDWENVYQIWRTFVSEGCSLMFRWPTPIADSDDDLKSEVTDLTYTCTTRSKKTVPNYRHEPTKSAGQLIKPENSDKSSEKMCLNCSRSMQNSEKTRSSVKSFASDAEEHTTTSIAQTKNTSNEDNVRNINRMNVISLQRSPERMNRLRDVIQEDKLNMIISNLENRNCSQEYIDKIIEMFDCLDYVVSYSAAGSEYNSDPVVSTSGESIKTATTRPLQQINVCNRDNRANANNQLEDSAATESKSHVHSSLGYGSLKNDTNPPVQPTNARSKNSTEGSEDLDKSESEVYAGVPKISIEQVLRARKESGRMFKHKMRKKAIPSDTQRCATQSRAAHGSTTSIANVTKILHLNESCVSITEDEIEMLDARRGHRAANVAERLPQEIPRHSRQEARSDNFNVYGGRNVVASSASSVTQAFDALEAQRVRSSAFIREQRASRRGTQGYVQHAQATDVDYINSDERDVVTVASAESANEIAGIVPNERPFDALETRRSSAFIKKSDQEDVVSILSVNTNVDDRLDEPRVSRDLRREFIEQPKNEATSKAKPTVISSIPVNLNLKITNRDLRKTKSPPQPWDSDSAVVSVAESERDKQRASVRPTTEKVHRKKSITTKTSSIASDSRTTVDSKKEDRATSNTATRNDKSASLVGANNPASSTTKLTTRSMMNLSEQAKSSKLEESNPKLLTAWMPKVVYDSKSNTELGLVFHGKLLNEVGHVVQRNFTTDIVLRRLSPTLIETVNRELYQLLGCLNNNKHIIPKELVKQCYNGCPMKIEQFCLTWKSLQHGEMEKFEEKLHDASIDTLSVPVSSRGRRRLPPLSYWTGERVTLKDNTPVYSPGNSQESSLASLNESLNSKTLANIEVRKKQRTDSKNASKKNEDTSKQKALSNETNETSKQDTNKIPMIVVEKIQSSNKSPKAMSNAKRSDGTNKFRKVAMRRQRISQQLTFSSTDSSEEEQEVSSRKRARNSQPSANAAVTSEASEYTMKLRKRQKTATSLNKALRSNMTKPNCDTTCSPTKRPKYDAYYRSISLLEDSLSEVSSI